MRLSHFAVPLCLSTAIHLCLVLIGGFLLSKSGQHADVVVKKERQVITLAIVPFEERRSSNSSSMADLSRELTEETTSAEGQRHLQTRPDPQQVETKRESQRVKEKPSPSPPVGEGRDGGDRNARFTPTLTLPHQGGGDEDLPLSARMEGNGRSVMISATTMTLPKPKYPRYSRRHGEEGRVILSIEIDANGERRKIEIVSSSGYSRLDQAAVQALEKATFIPARIDGKGVLSVKQMAFTFKLEDTDDR